MKTYKTWEVIKMLTENPSLKFKDTNTSQVLPYIKITNGILAWSNGSPLNFRLEDKVFNNSFNYEWQLIQDPVTFMEAAEAFKNGKNVRCEYPSFTSGKPCTMLFEQSEEGNGSIDWAPNKSLTFYLVTNGKWFIQEEEDNE